MNDLLRILHSLVIQAQQGLGYSYSDEILRMMLFIEREANHRANNSYREYQELYEFCTLQVSKEPEPVEPPKRINDKIGFINAVASKCPNSIPLFFTNTALKKLVAHSKSLTPEEKTEFAVKIANSLRGKTGQPTKHVLESFGVHIRPGDHLYNCKANLSGHIKAAFDLSALTVNTPRGLATWDISDCHILQI